jgi:hypothetical protein
MRGESNAALMYVSKMRYQIAKNLGSTITQALPLRDRARLWQKYTKMQALMVSCNKHFGDDDDWKIPVNSARAGLCHAVCCDARHTSLWTK